MKYIKTFEAAVSWNFKKRKIGDKIVCIYSGNQKDREIPARIGQTYEIIKVSPNGKMYKLKNTDDRWWFWNRFTDELDLSLIHI